MAESASEFPDFAGKVVSLSMRDDNANHDLHDPRFEVQGGRVFIIGTVPRGATESDWVAHRITAVAWDRVTEYYVFDCLEEYEQAIRKSEEFGRDRETEY